MKKDRFKVLRFIEEMRNSNDTFLSDYEPEYGFWPYLDYFLNNCQRWPNYDTILNKLATTVPIEIDKAWQKWQIFRSSQSEITTIFLIEEYLKGQVLELISEDVKKPTPDLRIDLSGKILDIEIKAQSGQQHGDKHPRTNDLIMFNTQSESDLKSWLFEKRISSRDGKPMKPKTLEAENKGANILVSMIDIFHKVEGIQNWVSIICPENKFLDFKKIELPNSQSLTISFFSARLPILYKMNYLKEIWLFDESNLNDFVVLSQGERYLLEHFKRIDC